MLVSKDISISMALNLYILTKTSRSSVDEVKVQEGKSDMDIRKI